MRIAVWQAPLLDLKKSGMLGLARKQVSVCEAQGVDILCCPEALLGGLADDAADPGMMALNIDRGELDDALRPLRSASLTTIIGFTEASSDSFYNSAAILDSSRAVGVYRKMHPAIRRSVYSSGDSASVFRVKGTTFGVLICNDSNHAEPAESLVAQGAHILFIPTNNALPPERADVVQEALAIDRARAKRARVWIARADVAGRTDGRLSYGCSWIIDSDGEVVVSSEPFHQALLVADLGARREP